jgi:acyl-CoA synthetase (AMP-forming)/AMP-acid ligase II
MALLSDKLVEHAATQANAEALVFESTRLSYGELNERVNRLASGLGSLGLRRGDHVALMLGNCNEYLEVYYALTKAGMVAVPPNWRLSEQELAYIVDHAEAVALITDQTHAGTARVLRARLDRLARLVGVRVDFVDELPKSTVGKILRREIRSRYAGKAV